MKKKLNQGLLASIIIIIIGILIYGFIFIKYKQKMSNYKINEDIITSLNLQSPENIDNSLNSVQSKNQSLEKELSQLNIKNKEKITNGLELKIRLKESIKQWQNDFQNPEIYFGFKNYISSESLPQDDKLKEVSSYLEATKVLIDILKKCEINKINLFERGPILEEKIQDEILILKNIIPLVNYKEIKSYLFKIEFESSIQSFQDFINTIGNVNTPFFIRNIEINQDTSIETNILLEYITYQEP